MSQILSPELIAYLAGEGSCADCSESISISDLTGAEADHEIALNGFVWQVGSDVTVGISFDSPNGITLLGDTNSVGNQTNVKVDDTNSTITNISVLGKYQFDNVAEYTDNAAALLGGLTTGMIYRTGDNLKIVH